MLRMSFLEHLEELRRRIFLMLVGVGVAFAASLTFSKELWHFVQAPAVDALTTLGIKGINGGPPQLTQGRGSCIRFGHSLRPACTSASGTGPVRLSSARPACSFWAAVSAISWRFVTG
jgi:hypothetical protein